MSQKVTLTIMKLSIVLMLIALVLFFMVRIEEPGFIAVCITMAFCSMVFLAGVLFLKFDKDNPLTTPKTIISLASWFGIVIICVVIKIILYYV